MTTTTLTETPDVERAATDSDYYADTIKQLGGQNSPQGSRFMAEVERAYNAAKALGYVERAILKFEKDAAESPYPTPGHREQAILDQFGFNAIRYYQLLNWLIDKPAAFEAEPVLVNRLRRQRAYRRAQRRLSPQGSTR